MGSLDFCYTSNMNRNSLPLEKILEHFYIEDGVMKWNHDVKYGAWKKKGDSAGTPGNNGYLRINLKTDKKRFYMVHRLMFQIYNNVEELDPSLDIDHVDRNVLNNSMENLRIANRSENNCNNNIRKDNKSGYSNISIEEMLTTRTYVVNVQKDKVNHSGRFKNLDDAILFRDSLRKELHGEFSKNS